MSIALCLFETGWSVNLFGLYVPLKLRPREVRHGEIMESWGLGIFNRAIHLTWGHRSKIIGLPWEWKHLKCEVRRPDGSWVHYVAPHGDNVPFADGRWQENYPYRYDLLSGETQTRTATVYVERREWRWRWMPWSPWPSVKRQSIDVRFDAEVGERTGSWKGGTLGCGYDMKPSETALQSLRRMEREREFA